MIVHIAAICDVGCQSAILLAIGLQRKDVDDVEKDLKLEVRQVWIVLGSCSSD